MTDKTITLNSDGSYPITDPIYREHLLFTASRVKLYDVLDEKLKKIALRVAKGMLKEKKPRKVLKQLLKDLQLMHEAVNAAAEKDRREQVEMIDTMFPILVPEDYGMAVECMPLEGTPGVFDLRVLPKELLEEEQRRRADS